MADDTISKSDAYEILRMDDQQIYHLQTTADEIAREWEWKVISAHLVMAASGAMRWPWSNEIVSLKIDLRVIM